MGTLFIRQPAIRRDRNARLCDPDEPPPVQALVPELAMEALAKAILPGAARIDAERLGALLAQPRSERPSNELRRIVALEQPGRAAVHKQTRQDADHLDRRQ